MCLRVSAVKRLIIISTLLCITACAHKEPHMETIRICDSNGCTDRPRNYSSFDPAKDTPEEDPGGNIAALEAIAARDPNAAYDLALRFFRGDGIPQDSYRSIKWMRNAAEKGDLNAQMALGRLYLTGLGEMGSDPGEAEKWLTITASRGDQEASTLLKEATQARQSEQAEYHWYNRWRPIFYNYWYSGYAYNLYRGQSHAIIAKLPEHIAAGPQHTRLPYNNRSQISASSIHKDKQTNATVVSESPHLTAQQMPAVSVDRDKPLKALSSPSNHVVSPVTTKPSNSMENNKIERRVALVIGNGAYQHTSQLPNPANDAQDIAQVLRKYNFQVILKTDASLETMADVIYQFGESLKGGGVGLFYYAGHGLQVKGENYLLPVDANLMREDDIKRKAINANDVMEKMGEGKSHLNLVFLDACRNNPFPSSTRAVSRGLIGMNAPNGTLIVFSTNPGNVAADGNGRNGIFTKHLLQQINQPALEIGMMLRKVRSAVKEETGGQQVPWENGSIEGEFYFNNNSP